MQISLKVGKEDGETNLADLLTKVLTGEKRWNLLAYYVVEENAKVQLPKASA